MNNTFAERLHAYADLLVRIGVNVQPGQKLLVRADTNAAPLVRKVAEIAYGIGSPLVEVLWGDEGVTRARFANAPTDSFENLPVGRAETMLELAEEGAASLAIVSDDPDLLAGVAPEGVTTFQRAWQTAMRPYAEILMSDGIAWCVAAAAAPAWARRVFPDVAEAEAVTQLWDAIFAATRVTEEDPVAAWEAHAEQLALWKERLNERHYVALRFRAPGTDLRVGLADGHVWEGGVSHTPDDTRFVPNMPTEEVFTAPHREQVDGVVRASKPLAHHGTIISDFELRFEGGRVMEAWAGSGKQELDSILETDEGASHLGEVALVPASSPIAKTGVLFLNTLFDENAASHLALGKGYAFTVEGAADMTSEQSQEAGLNDSLVHVDFMIGSAEMDVDGETASGDLEPVMRDGEWVE